jgi:hypothetical protein
MLATIAHALVPEYSYKFFSYPAFGNGFCVDLKVSASDIKL